VTAEVVTGSDDMSERGRKIADFKNGRIRALVNCNVLTTGFDAPSVDLVALVRATESTGLYIQMVGRGTRKAPGKTDCLLLDYGGNVARHGFIDTPTPKKNGGTGDGKAPVKQCPSCNTFCHTAVRMCPECSFEFPAPQLNHAPKSYEGAVLSNQVKSEWMEVDDVSYGRWQKEGKPDSIRVTYYCGMTRLSEWLCPDHGGYAASRYTARKQALGAKADSTSKALMECADWVKPSRILVKPDGKYFQIVQLDYTQKKPPAETELDRDLKEMFADDF